MKKLLVLLFLFSTASFSQTRDIVPRADGEGYIGTMGKHWLGANLDSLNGVATGDYVILSDSNSVFIPWWMKGQFVKYTDTTSVIAMQWELDGKFNTTDTSAFNSKTLTTAQLALKADKGDTTNQLRIFNTVTVPQGGTGATTLTGIVKGNGASAFSAATGADLPVMSATVGGAVPTPPNNTTTFLRGDGTFATPSGVGETNTASNLNGLGAGLFKAKSTYDLQFKRLKALGYLTITDATDSVMVLPDTSAGKLATKTDVAAKQNTIANLNNGATVDTVEFFNRIFKGMIISFPLDSSYINVTDTVWCDLPEYALTVDSISVSPSNAGTAVSIVPKFLYRTAPYQTATAIITSPATITSTQAKTWQSTIAQATLPANGQLGILHTTVTTKPKQESIGIKVHR